MPQTEATIRGLEEILDQQARRLEDIPSAMSASVDTQSLWDAAWEGQDHLFGLVKKSDEAPILYVYDGDEGLASGLHLAKARLTRSGTKVTHRHQQSIPDLAGSPKQIIQMLLEKAATYQM